MKKASNHLPDLKTVEQQPVSSSTTSHSATLPDKTVARFFAKMQAMYLNTWSSNFKNEDEVRAAMSIWGESLADLHIQQITRGLRACESRAGFPPTLGEFKRLAVGLPSKSESIARVLSRDGSDPLTLSIMRRIGGHELRTLAANDIERKAGRFYDDLFPKVLAEYSGDETEWSPDRQLEDRSVPAENKPPLSKDETKSAISELKKSRGYA